MERLTDRLHTAADALATVGRSVPVFTVPPGAFAADDGGLPGRVGRRLHTHWSAALAARAREAADASARLTELATALRITEREYTEADRAVGRRIERTGR
jgi:hypothetical protein